MAASLFGLRRPISRKMNCAADIRFLKHLWTEIRTRAESSKSPSLIYHDLNLVERIFTRPGDQRLLADLGGQ